MMPGLEICWLRRQLSQWLLRGAVAPPGRPGPPGRRRPDLVTDSLAIAWRAAGIDFGTARSGYAFALGTDQQVVQVQLSWPGELIQQAKTLTALLYDTTTWRPIAWGMEAYKQ
jgi:hypothetical protein